MNVFAFKQPSFIKKVDYAKLVNELYESKVAEDDQQDVYIKKLVANVNIGLLEKCSNKKSTGYRFQDYDECKFYQASTEESSTAFRKSRKSPKIWKEAT
jgi:hypothetical protein